MVAPLNWGLGHAARCIPIIKHLLQRGIAVSVAAEERPAALLKSEFPDLPFFELPGYDISYPVKRSMTLQMLKTVPQILRGINGEHQALQKLIDSHKIDAVISDNRYGLYSQKVPCVIITHQLNVKTPWGGGLVRKANFKLISKFQACWIPDFSNGQNLSGNLAQAGNSFPRHRFIGPLSRFSPPAGRTEKDIDVLAVISGPEPQRTKFEEMVLKESLKTKQKVVVVAGRTDELTRSKYGNVEVFSSVKAQDLEQLMHRAKLVLCRSGYSSIMDLAVMGNQAVFVPTPGQTEQEYLAKLHLARGNYYCMTQNQFNWDEMTGNASNFTGIQIDHHTVFKSTVNEFADTI